MFRAYLLTFLISCMPFLELRGGLPIGHLHFGLPIWHAFAVALIGNILAVVVFRHALPYVEHFAREYSPWIDGKIKHLYEKTHTHHSHKVEALGSLFLITFVAIPIPGSGGLTAILIAYLFDLPYWLTLGVISIGLLLSGFIVMGLTLGVDFIF